jgi:serine/threonine protein kinase
MSTESNLQPLQPPPIEGYEYSHRIAVGGMAEIFLAWQRGPGGFRRQVAVKHALPHLTADPDFVDLLLREAHIAADLSHSNIVSVLDVLNPGGRECLIVMEYVHGPTLRALLGAAAKKPIGIPAEVTAHVVLSMCAALDYAHNSTDVGGRPRKIVHRDVTPTNILLGMNGQVKLGDFGIARTYAADSVTRTGVIRGKAAYMSPEQTRGEALDQRSDLFSVGVVLFEMVTGAQPFLRPGGEAAIARAILTDPIPDPKAIVPNLNPALARVIQGALARDRDDRYESAAELASDLRAALGYSPASAAASLAGFLKMLFPNMAPKPEEQVREEPQDPAETSTTVVVTRSRRNPTSAPGEPISTPPAPPAAAAVRLPNRSALLFLYALALISALAWWVAIARAR